MSFRWLCIAFCIFWIPSSSWAAECQRMVLNSQHSGQNDWRINASNFDDLRTSIPGATAPNEAEVYQNVVAAMLSFNNETESKAFISYTPSTIERPCAGENVIRVQSHCAGKYIAKSVPRCALVAGNLNRASMCASNWNGKIEWGVGEGYTSGGGPDTTDFQSVLKHEILHAMDLAHHNDSPSVTNDNSMSNSWRYRELYEHDSMCLEKIYGIRSRSARVTRVGGTVQYPVYTVGQAASFSISRFEDESVNRFYYWLRKGPLSSMTYTAYSSTSMLAPTFTQLATTATTATGRSRKPPVVLRSRPHISLTSLRMFNPGAIRLPSSSQYMYESRDTTLRNVVATSATNQSNSGQYLLPHEGGAAIQERSTQPIHTAYLAALDSTVFAYVRDGRYSHKVVFGRPSSWGDQILSEIPTVKFGAKPDIVSGKFAAADRVSISSVVGVGLACMGNACVVYHVPAADSLFRIHRTLMHYDVGKDAFVVWAGTGPLSSGGSWLHTSAAIVAWPVTGSTGVAQLAFQSHEPRFPVVRVSHAVLGGSANQRTVLSVKSIAGLTVAPQAAVDSDTWVGWIE